MDGDDSNEGKKSSKNGGNAASSRLLSTSSMLLIGLRSEVVRGSQFEYSVLLVNVCFRCLCCCTGPRLGSSSSVCSLHFIPVCLPKETAFPVCRVKNIEHCLSLCVQIVVGWCGKLSRLRERSVVVRDKGEQQAVGKLNKRVEALLAVGDG